VTGVQTCALPIYRAIEENQNPKPETRLICILQGATYKMLASSSFDMAIIDPDDSKLNKIDIENLHSQNKKLFSYLSIGEAENYRYYWKKDWKTGNPDFVENENPNWKGNFKIKYWDEEWQKIVLTMLEKIINTGYDGVYLDVVDAYKYFEALGYVNARKQMVDFVILLSEYSKNINANFLIIPQNAEELIEFEGYLDAIDGAGRESLWFLNDTLQNKEELEDSLAYLDRIKNSGRLVFLISYCCKDKNINDFKRLALKHGFIPYIGSKELDNILNP
jgi:cysteinyl-tRNA synthetase, unknown class